MAATFGGEEIGSGLLSEATPEPSSIVSLGLIGLALAGIRKKANQ
ncbi:MAG: PEP-CTERM sorting domain-containing protein [Cyanobacteria bacterium P01_H01_bin.35]